MTDEKKPKTPKRAVIHIPGPSVKSTEGISHKQHKDRNVGRPAKPPAQRKGK
jgi:hypothetical protein